VRNQKKTSFKFGTIFILDNSPINLIKEELGNVMLTLKRKRGRLI